MSHRLRFLKASNKVIFRSILLSKTLRCLVHDFQIIKLQILDDLQPKFPAMTQMLISDWPVQISTFVERKTLFSFFFQGPFQNEK